MNSLALRNFANSLLTRHTAIDKYKREAAFIILEKSKLIDNYISDEDRINQAVEYYTKVWKSSFELTSNTKFKAYLSVAKQAMNQMATFNEVEHLVKEKYDDFNQLVEYVRTTAWANKVSYNILKEVYSIMELNHDA